MLSRVSACFPFNEMPSSARNPALYSDLNVPFQLLYFQTTSSIPSYYDLLSQYHSTPTAQLSLPYQSFNQLKMSGIRASIKRRFSHKDPNGTKLPIHLPLIVSTHLSTSTILVLAQGDSRYLFASCLYLSTFLSLLSSCFHSGCQLVAQPSYPWQTTSLFQADGGYSQLRRARLW
jgi:hypothetical protein